MEARNIKLRADVIRKTLRARHEKDSAVSDILESLSDESLVEMNDSETKATLENLRAKRIRRIYTRCEKKVGS